MSGCWFTRHSEADMGLLGVVCYFKEGKKNADSVIYYSYGQTDFYFMI